MYMVRHNYRPPSFKRHNLVIVRLFTWKFQTLAESAYLKIICLLIKYSLPTAVWRSLGSVRTWPIVSSLSYRNAVSTEVHRVWGAAGLRPRAPAFCVVHRRSRPTDRCSAFLFVRRWHSGLQLVPTVWCQHAPSQHVAVHPRRRELDAIGCSWTHRRQSLFGALLHAVAITFQMEMYKSATAHFIRSSPPETSVCTSTMAWRWGLT